MAVLLQFAENDQEIQLFDIWNHPAQQTLDLIEYFVNHEGGLVMFNAAFDFFHLCKLYTVFSLLPDKQWIPIEHIDAIANLEAAGRDGPCLKPHSVVDLMLVARKTAYQSTMERDDIIIKKVPTALAFELAKELTRVVPLKGIYFARKQDKKQWQVDDIFNEFEELVPMFKNVVLRFAPSSALKALAVDALGIEEATYFSDIGLPASAMPEELGYAPFATAIGQTDQWNLSWPDYGRIKIHNEFWELNPMAREYAEKDVEYTRKLFWFFSAKARGKSDAEARIIANDPTHPIAPMGMDDNDSVLACAVAAVRWRGYSIDLPKMTALRDSALARTKTKLNFASAAVCKIYLQQVMTPLESAVLKVDGLLSTKGTILEEVSRWKINTICTECNGLSSVDQEGNDVPCPSCGGTGLIPTAEQHPAALRAREILDLRHAKKEVELFEKFLLAGRFHASFKVIGALSGRMAGGDGLNAQGINRSKEIRRAFPLAWGDLRLSGGDFSGFEVSIMDAAFRDPVLHQKLISKHVCMDCKGTGIDPRKGGICSDCKGTKEVPYKIHALFGQHFFPGKDYWGILATKGQPNELDLYDRSKKGLFAIAYGGEAYTLVNRVGIPEEQAQKGYESWCREHKVWAQEREKVLAQFRAIEQPAGIRTRVIWTDPKEFVESMFGFRRYFTLEQQIQKALFQMAEKPPPHWNQIQLKVVRRDREQTVTGALKSACYGAAFAIQGNVMRAAGNHVIQATGAEACKMLQRKLWGLQPTGISRWVVQPANIHDELMVPMLPDLVPAANKIVADFISDLKTKIPLAAIEWGNDLKSWAEK